MLSKSYFFPFFISIGGYVFMVSMDTVIKVLGSSYPVLQLLFLNALFSLIPLTYLIIKNHGFKSVITTRGPDGISVIRKTGKNYIVHIRSNFNTR